MIAYPERLPSPQREDYGFDPVSPNTGTPLATGRTIQRVTYTSTPTVVPVTWLLTPSEALLFEGWWEYTLRSGTLPFKCPLLTPLGFESYQVQFVSIYRGPILVGVDMWKFSAQLRLFKRPLIDKEWVVDAPDYILDADIFDRAMNQEWPKHTES